MYSVMVARYKYFPEVKTKGMSAAPRLVLFTSEYVSIEPVQLCFSCTIEQKHCICLPLEVIFFISKISLINQSL